MSGAEEAVVLDCEAGRRLGCQSFCCRLLVRLESSERDPGRGGDASKHCVDKGLDGLCVYFESESGRCTVWERRPALCRAYDCNRDPLLQVVLRDGFHSLTALVAAEPPPPERWVRVPYHRASRRED